ncbi:MAG: hypothetical protein K2O41_04675 [Clostridia bacterium]|nr:hypothetical protein [Clostridia bacterium]
MMYVKKVLNYDESSTEAEVIVSDGEFEILCYAWGFNPNCTVGFSLSAFLVTDVEKSDGRKCYAVPNSRSYFACDICGRLIEGGKISVGSILIDVDIKDIPKDIKLNDYVKLSCTRIDFIQVENA